MARRAPAPANLIVKGALRALPPDEARRMKRVFPNKTVYLRHPMYKSRAWLRTSDLSLILSTAALGAVAGLATVATAFLAHSMQRLLYGVGINRLSALGSIHHPLKLLVLPLAGAILGGVYWLSRRRSAPIDVVEANALHGGRIPLLDTFWIDVQTLISNGFGASVGLEAAYAQTGGGIGSMMGRWLRLRRADMRNLVGAGAGAAIAAAFAAPLTGAFYCVRGRNRCLHPGWHCPCGDGSTRRSARQPRLRRDALPHRSQPSREHLDA